jgi:P27 family predicted phage terminase small subunit
MLDCSMAQRGRKSHASLAVVPIEPAVMPTEREFPPPESPEYLGEPERQIWRDVFHDFDLSTRAAIAVLITSLEAHQRARECRETIAREGLTVVGRDGQAKAHPLLAVERDARQAWLAGIRALGLEL